MIFGRKKSVETITAKLNDTINELEAHAEHQLGRAVEQRRLAAEAHAARVEHEREHELARKVASNIRALLS